MAVPAFSGSGERRTGGHVSSSQKRRAPAFQVYASDDLASEDYFRLTLAERGLADAMRRACWVSIDGTIPRDAEGIALLIRRPEDEVRAALTAAVLRCFQEAAHPERLTESDLDRQRNEFAARRKAQSAGSAVGLEAIREKREINETRKTKRNGKLRASPETGPGTGSGTGLVLRRSEMSRKEVNGGEDPYAHLYHAAEPAEEYDE